MCPPLTGTKIITIGRAEIPKRSGLVSPNSVTVCRDKGRCKNTPGGGGVVGEEVNSDSEEAG